MFKFSTMISLYGDFYLECVCSSRDIYQYLETFLSITTVRGVTGTYVTEGMDAANPSTMNRTPLHSCLSPISPLWLWHGGFTDSTLVTLLFFLDFNFFFQLYMSFLRILSCYPVSFLIMARLYFLSVIFS